MGRGNGHSSSVHRRHPNNDAIESFFARRPRRFLRTGLEEPTRKSVQVDTPTPSMLLEAFPRQFCVFFRTEKRYAG